jgi:hypothetical protein
MLVVFLETEGIFSHFIGNFFSSILWFDLRHMVDRLTDDLWIHMVFKVIKVGFVLVVKVESVCILEFFILFSGLGFAAIAFFAEREVHVIAVEAQPVSLPGLVLGSGMF